MKRSALPTRLLLFGTALLLPCFLFTAGNVLLSPWPLYHRSRLCLLLLTPVCLAFLLFLLPRIAGILSPLLQRRERVVLCIFAAAFFLVQVALSLTLRHIPITDAEQCFTAASLLCDTGAFETSERAYVYFSRYPFNLGFVYLLSALFRFCGWLGWTDRFAAAVVFAALLFAAGLLCTAKLTRRLGGPGAQARLLVLFPLCLPFLTCCAEVYTDVFAVSFPPMILLAFQNALDAKSRRNRLLHALAFALLSFAGIQLRATAAIALIACFLRALFEGRLRTLLALALCTLAVLVPGTRAVESANARHLGADNLAAHRLSVWHYLAMGLPVRVDEGYGQYGEGGWLIFSTSFEDPAERDAALRSEIRDRVYYLRYPSRMLHMMSRKNLSSFGDGTFRLNEIIEGDEHTPDNAVKQVVYGRGAFHGAYQHLCTAWQLALLLLCCLSCLSYLRRGDTGASALFLTLLGAFLYLCLWETKARYFFMFQMILLSACALHAPGSMRFPGKAPSRTKDTAR